MWGEKVNYGRKYMGIIRSAFVIDETGKLAGVFYKISPKDTVPKVTKVLEELSAEPPDPCVRPARIACQRRPVRRSRSGADGVEAAVDVDDLAGGGGEPVGEQRDARPWRSARRP